MQFETLLTDESATLRLARQLGELLEGKGLIFLTGDLGAGKTTFCRGILRSFGYQGAVKSPTFTIVEPYDLEWGQVFHFDLYRLADPEELEYLGVDDYLSGEYLCLIEWPEKGEGYLPRCDLHIDLKVVGLQRKITLSAMSPDGERVCQQLIENYRVN